MTSRRAASSRAAAGATAAAAGGAVLARSLLSGAPPSPDEAGYLLVAAAARPGGPFLYGPLWVDRPPLLVAVFALAAHTGGVAALRGLALVAVAALVLLAGAAGRLVSGARGAVAASATAAALASTPLLSAPKVDGGLLAAPVALLALLLALRAAQPAALPAAAPGTGGPERSKRARTLLVAAAGLVGACAPLVKQNAVDGLVGAGVLVVVLGLSRRVPVRRAAGLLGALAAGAAVPVLAVGAWALSWGSGPVGLWRQLVAFRGASLAVITEAGSPANTARADDLLLVALRSGLALLVVLFVVVAAPRVRRLEPVPAVVAAVLGLDVVAIALGGSYWVHYLLQLVPAAALAAADLAGRARAVRAAAAAAVALACASSVLAVVAWAPHADATGCRAGASKTTTGRWVGEAAAPGDTVVVVFGGASTVLASGLRPAYPYLWSLPVRTLDPHLQRLRAAVTGPAAATWVVLDGDPDAWGLDRDGRFRAALAAGYRPVAQVCGRSVLLRDGVQRDGVRRDPPASGAVAAASPGGAQQDGDQQRPPG